MSMPAPRDYQQDLAGIPALAARIAEALKIELDVHQRHAEATARVAQLRHEYAQLPRSVAYEACAATEKACIAVGILSQPGWIGKRGRE